MASTGEVACLGKDVHDAFLKSLLASGYKVPRENILISLGGRENKEKFLDSAGKLASMGYKLFATPKTSEFLEKSGIPNFMVHKISERKSPNIRDCLKKNRLDMIINIPENYAHKEMTDGYFIRRKAADLGIPLITNRQLAKLFTDSIASKKAEDLEIKAWDEYLKE